MDEFHTVRVLNEPIGGSSSNTPNSSGNPGKKGVSVGIDVLIGVGSFFALCFLLFGLRWVLLRRRYRRENLAGVARDSKDPPAWGDYQLANRASELEGIPSEDTLRAARFDAYMRNQRVQSHYTMSSGQTLAEEGADEEGFPKKLGTAADDLAAIDFPEPPKHLDAVLDGPAVHHRRTDSDLSGESSDANAGRSSPGPSRHDRRPGDRSLSISVPLLSPQSGAEDEDFGVSSLGSMAGVGSGRGSMAWTDNVSGKTAGPSPSFSSPRSRSRPHRTSATGAQRSLSPTSTRQNVQRDSGT